MSTGPVSRARALTASVERTSRARVLAPPRSASLPRSRSVAQTVAPSSMKASAMARPMPCPAAVMTADLPSSRPAMLSSRFILPLFMAGSAELAQPRRQGGQHARHDNRDALFIRVHHVRLVEARIKGDAVEKERIEGCAVLLCQRGIKGVESRGVVGAEAAIGLHAGDEDRQLARDEFLHDGIEIGG